MCNASAICYLLHVRATGNYSSTTKQLLPLPVKPSLGSMTNGMTQSIARTPATAVLSHTKGWEETDCFAMFKNSRWKIVGDIAIGQKPTVHLRLPEGGLLVILP